MIPKNIDDDPGDLPKERSMVQRQSGKASIRRVSIKNRVIWQFDWPHYSQLRSPSSMPFEFMAMKGGLCQRN